MAEKNPASSNGGDYDLDDEVEKLYHRSTHGTECS